MQRLYVVKTLRVVGVVIPVALGRGARPGHEANGATEEA